MPNKEETEHLAKLIKNISAIPPLSWIQTILRKIFPFTGGGKAGSNPYADIFIYLMAWHTKNENLTKAVYIREPKVPDIPFYPKAQVLAELREQAQQNGKVNV